MKRILLLMFLTISIICNAQLLEKDYQKIFAQDINGNTEYRLEDASRVDIITDEYAIEVDWAKKWSEAIGQSLYYAKQTNKRAGIVLIIKDYENEEKYIKRLMSVACNYGITVWLIYFDFRYEEYQCFCD